MAALTQSTFQSFRGNFSTICFEALWNISTNELVLSPTMFAKMIRKSWKHAMNFLYAVLIWSVFWIEKIFNSLIYGVMKMFQVFPILNRVMLFESIAKIMSPFILNCYRRLLSSNKICTCLRWWLSKGHLSVRQLFGLYCNQSTSIAMVTILQFVFIKLLIRCRVIFSR